VPPSAGRRQNDPTNFHFTHWENNHVVEKIDFADVSALYEALQTRFGLGVTIQTWL
jgi:N-hydroxyarylamine O-acetyltransferase